MLSVLDVLYTVYPLVSSKTNKKIIKAIKKHNVFEILYDKMEKATLSSKMYPLMLNWV